LAGPLFADIFVSFTYFQSNTSYQHYCVAQLLLLPDSMGAWPLDHVKGLPSPITHVLNPLVANFWIRRCNCDCVTSRKMLVWCIAAKQLPALAEGYFAYCRMEVTDIAARNLNISIVYSVYW